MIKLNQIKNFNNLNEFKLKTIDVDTNKFFNGGLNAQGLYFLTGTPGVGKSSFLQTLSCLFIKQNTKENCVLFASNEQTANFIKFNIDRISASSNSIYDNFYVEDNFINIDDLESHIKTFKLIGFKSILIIIDSLQNCTTTNTQTKSVKQKIKESLLRVRKLCEEYNVVCFIVGQVTKNKLFSGHNEIQHIVDAHIHIQQENLKKKILYLKNRFGDLTAEVELSNNYKICYEQHTISKKSIYQYLILLKNVLYITWNIISRSILFIFPSKIENKTKSKKRKK